jgi:hypothetical protein
MHVRLLDLCDLQGGFILNAGHVGHILLSRVLSMNPMVHLGNLMYRLTGPQSYTPSI